MRKFQASLLDANLYIARAAATRNLITVRPIRLCGGCNAPATTMINGAWPRCQRCANQVVNIWNEMRAAKDAALEGEDL